MTSDTQETLSEEASIYELLFKLPSVPSDISPSVVRHFEEGNSAFGVSL